MVKVLLTGASGFIGKHLLSYLLAQGEYDVSVLGRHQIESVRRGNSYLVDLCKFTDVERAVQFIKPDVVFHLAALGMYNGKEASEEAYTENNILGTVNLLKAMREYPYRVFVNTGSSSEYGIKRTPMREDDACNPESAYAITKLAGTLFAQRENRYFKKPVVTFRLFSPYGPNDSPKRFFPYMVGGVAKGEKVAISSPYAKRDYVYIDDVVRAYFKAIKHIDKIQGEVINIGSGIERTMIGVVDTTSQVTGKHFKVVLGDTDRNFESPRWQADIAKAKRLMKWWPKVSLREGIRRML